MPQSASINLPSETAPSSSSEQSWKPPDETGMTLAAEQKSRMGFSPKPTPPPLPQGRFGRMDLMRRLRTEYYLTPGICGYGKEDQQPLSCVNTEAICTTSSQYLGCCVPNEGDCTINTACMNYEAWKSGKCNGSDPRTICCTDQKRSACSVFLRFTGGPGTTVTAIDCDTYSGTGTLLGYDPKWASSNSYTPSPWSSAPEAPTSVVATPTDTAGDGVGGGGGTSVGAIVGAVVGGIAALVLIGIVALLLLRRRKHSSPQIPAVQGGQPQDPTSDSLLPKGHDLHMSIYSQHESFSPSGHFQMPKHSQGHYPPHQPSNHAQLGITPNVEPGKCETGLDATPPPGAQHHHQLGELPADDRPR